MKKEILKKIDELLNKGIEVAVKENEDIQCKIKEEGNVMINNENTKLKVEEDRVYSYRMFGEDIAKGTKPLYVIEDYLNNIGEDLGKQVWVDVLGFDNYEVSNLGLIRNKETKKYLSPTFKERYKVGKKAPWRLRVNLSRDGISYKKKLHVVVIEAFKGKVPKGMVVSHVNDIAIDNRLENLEFVSARRNQRIYWVLDELYRGDIGNEEVNDIYGVTQDLVEQIVGNRSTYIELEDEELREVSDKIGYNPSLIKEVYRFKKGKGTVFDEFTKVNGKFYDLEVEKLVGNVIKEEV